MKNLFILSTALFLSTGLFAQSDKYKIGVKIAPNIGWVKPESKHISHERNALRFGFGLVADIHFTDNYAIGTGLNIFQMGGEVSYHTLREGDNGQEIALLSRSYMLQYGEVPLTLKLRTNEIGYITYWGQFGLGLGVNIRATANDELDYQFTNENATINDPNPWISSDRETSVIENEDIKDDISLFRASLIIGAGIEYNLSGGTSILAGVTFNNGFTDILRNNGLQVNEADEVDFQEGDDNKQEPVPFQLKGIGNFFELSLGIMF